MGMIEQSSSLPTIGLSDPQQRRVRHILWILGGGIAALIAISFVMGALALAASEGALNPFTHLFFLPFITSIYGLTGFLVTRQQPGHITGWLLMLVALTSTLTLLSGAYTEFALYVLRIESSPLLDFCTWLDKFMWLVPSVIPLSLLLLTFPDGRLPSPRWRIIAWLTGLGMVGFMLASAFYPDPLPDFGMPAPNPYGIPGAQGLLGPVLNISSLFLLVGVMGAFVSVILRYRRAQGLQRTQLKWLMYAAGLVLTALIVTAALWLILPDSDFLVEVGIMLNSGGVAFIIAAIGVAILRHQLWDVDALISRTLVYGLLTLIVIGMYILTVSFFSLIFEGDNLFFSLVATGLVAVSFQPLRDAIQRGINRFLFGQRDEPYAIVQRVSEELNPAMPLPDTLPAMVTAIAESLRLPFVAIRLNNEKGPQLAADYPAGYSAPVPPYSQSIPLNYQSEQIGELILAPRSQTEPFSTTELALLTIIARQVAIAAYNLRLTGALQQSREQLVSAREEERRRLRRDLHDGLGPVLAAMSFRLDAIHNLVETKPEQAREWITDLKGQVQAALSDIRRIAYNLRPPALDELGLMGAMHEHVNVVEQAGLHFQLDLPPELPPLPAAVEVALYRIFMEGVTNVQRHAQASSCTVHLSLMAQPASICLELVDDGRGIASGHTPGVGLMAMRERTAELGGQFSVEPSAGGGTHIRARLPLNI